MQTTHTQQKHDLQRRRKISYSQNQPRTYTALGIKRHKYQTFILTGFNMLHNIKE